MAKEVSPVANPVTTVKFRNLHPLQQEHSSPMLAIVAHDDMIVKCNNHFPVRPMDTSANVLVQFRRRNHHSSGVNNWDTYWYFPSKKILGAGELEFHFGCKVALSITTIPPLTRFFWHCLE